MIKIFDFDGTLIDLWPRYHAVFCHLTGSDVALEEYRDVKMRIKRDEEVARELNCVLPNDYFFRKAELLEYKEFLKMDRLWFSKEELVKMIDDNAFILTKRRNKEHFDWEMNYLDLSCDYVVVSADTKAEWIKNNIDESVIVIGDSIEDLRTAFLPQVNAIAVGYGINRREDFDSLGVRYQFASSPLELLEMLCR